ncbi:MAG TPA: alpha/beta hydrolase, partial [Candidatus Saccharimonadales bacterium]|nr:alpha/beta hydrolase [Candidatus Saccharimonadales bacterium]
MSSVVSHATAPDGTELLVRHWPPVGTEPPWASLLLVHGLGEHSGRYEHVGDRTAAAGIDTWSYDQRGNGASGGRRGHVDRWSQYHDDLAERLSVVRAGAEGRPVVLYGHSMGGLIVAGYLLPEDAADRRPWPDLVVLGSPGLESTLAAWKKTLAPMLARVVPTLAVPTGIDPSTLSRDPSVGAIAGRDPLNGRAGTVRFGAEGLSEQARVRALAGQGFGVPTLVLHGLDDGLVPAAASEVFEGAPGVERRTYPGLRHELHNEPEGPA